MGNRPLTDDEREQVRILHAEGLGRNEIARRLGRGQRTVSLIAQDLGLEFTVTRTEEATKHRRAQLAEKRAILAEALTDDALRLSEQVWAPTVVYNFGGKDNTYESRRVPEPPAADKRQLMAAATNAAAQSLRLMPVEDEDGSQQARSLVGQLMAGLAGVYREQQAAEAAADEGAGDAP
jgi:transposase